MSLALEDTPSKVDRCRKALLTPINAVALVLVGLTAACSDATGDTVNTTDTPDGKKVTFTFTMGAIAVGVIVGVVGLILYRASTKQKDLWGKVLLGFLGIAAIFVGCSIIAFNWDWWRVWYLEHFRS